MDRDHDRQESEPDAPPVALRSADPALIEQVRAIGELLQVAILICPPGAPAPRARLLLEDATQAVPSHPSWGASVLPVMAGDGEAPDRGGRSGGGPDGGSRHGILRLPRQGEELLRRIRAAARIRQAVVVGVVGARGGVGASSLAAVLARAAAADRARTALVDLDAVGAGVDLLLGIEDEPGVRWADLTAPEGDYDSQQLTAALPTWHSARVLSADWRGGVPAPTGDAVLQALWGDLDVMVLDIARHDGWHRWSRMCDAVVLLAGCDVISAAGVQSTRRALGAGAVHLVVRGPSPGGLTAAEIAQACDVPLAAQMRPERALAAGLERGVAPGDHGNGPLMRTGRALAVALDLTGRRRAA
ncbi:septum site-determining protein Ssd [Pseudactinotalea sp. Z1732]|uniref:septum site-determining protein Ssd n=1 Tax=Pseudactinotalea sp. Z1732 TaxID=3413026 RepID=UPI003C79ABC4